MHGLKRIKSRPLDSRALSHTTYVSVGFRFIAYLSIITYTELCVYPVYCTFTFSYAVILLFLKNCSRYLNSDLTKTLPSACSKR